MTWVAVPVGAVPVMGATYRYCYGHPETDMASDYRFESFNGLNYSIRLLDFPGDKETVSEHSLKSWRSGVSDGRWFQQEAVWVRVQPGERPVLGETYRYGFSKDEWLFHSLEGDVYQIRNLTGVEYYNVSVWDSTHRTDGWWHKVVSNVSQETVDNDNRIVIRYLKRATKGGV